MAKKRPKAPRTTAPGTVGERVVLPPLAQSYRKSVRGIMKDLTGTHSTEIAMRLREGLTSRNLRLALKYIQFVTAYVDGKPVETHRMVGLQEGPSGAYDVSKLSKDDQKKLLAMLRKAKDVTEPSGDV
jgi:basic membrane lipoprotein Med (substrate-binding protein (PBP1-ABC) superfamily)